MKAFKVTLKINSALPNMTQEIIKEWLEAVFPNRDKVVVESVEEIVHSQQEGTDG